MYFDAPSPCVEIIDLSRPSDAAAATRGRGDGPRPDKKTGRRGKKIARRVDSWISLSNALSDPVGGLIVRYFPDAEQRDAFLRSSAYEELNQLLLRVIKRKGLYPRDGQGRNWSTR